MGVVERDVPTRGSARPKRDGVEGPVSASREIMIVEDDEDALDALQQYLRIFGYDSIPAIHGQQALDILHAGTRPALILLDLSMPVMDGWTFVKEISRDPELRDIPIAVTTALDAPPPVPPRSAGVYRKPIFLPQLLAIVREQCGEARVDAPDAAR